MFLMSVMDVVCTSTTYQLTLNQDHWFRDKEAAACVVRPKAPPTNKTLTRNITIAPGCTPKVTGRRCAEGFDAKEQPLAPAQQPLTAACPANTLPGSRLLLPLHSQLSSTCLLCVVVDERNRRQIVGFHSSRVLSFLACRLVHVCV